MSRVLEKAPLLLFLLFAVLYLQLSDVLVVSLGQKSDLFIEFLLFVIQPLLKLDIFSGPFVLDFADSLRPLEPHDLRQSLNTVLPEVLHTIEFFIVERVLDAHPAQNFLVLTADIH